MSGVEGPTGEENPVSLYVASLRAREAEVGWNDGFSDPQASYLPKMFHPR